MAKRDSYNSYNIMFRNCFESNLEGTGILFSFVHIQIYYISFVQD